IHIFLFCTFFLLCPSAILSYISKHEVLPKNYQHVLSLVFAVNEVNKNPNILSNITLGFQIYDSYSDAKMTYQNTLNLISHHRKIIPNYKCGVEQKLVAAIGGLDSETSSHMASILELYKILQITYSSFTPAVSEKDHISSLYQMAPSEEHQYTGIVQLLLYFQWKWVGIFVTADDKGETFLKKLTHQLSRNGICIAVTERIVTHRGFDNTGLIEKSQNMAESLSKTNVNVFVVNADKSTMTGLQWLLLIGRMMSVSPINKVWVMTADWDFSWEPYHKDLDVLNFHGALSFAIHSSEVKGFHHFLLNLNPHSEANGFIRLFWQQAFGCQFLDVETEEESCTGEEKLESLPGAFFEMQMTSQSYSIYNAIYAVAHALHAMLAPRTKQGEMLQPFLRNILFNNSAGDIVFFNEKRELEGGFDIINWVTFPNKSFLRVKVGKMDPQAPLGIAISHLYKRKEQTKYNQKHAIPSVYGQVVPLALCNDYCHPGCSRQRKEGEPFCCYDCTPCPEGKISNQTALVFGIFIQHQNTPIVKANNQNLTYTLLISLLLCFLCSLLFIGRPQLLTCNLRQTTFGIIFSVAVSSVLAKTLTVVLAFMATKPGSKMRKWVRTRFSTSIVLGCTSIQASICIVWLCTDPPFPDLNMHSLPEEVIVECNEGSANMFYYVLGYMGLLALVSFVVAFFARKLPDTFNEAKFITFSMLVFCSVWLSFVPSYLSTKGKYIVAVEIFSILASSAGILGCIFSPKCYIIVFKPELNSKEQLKKRNK
uniref:G-protein coupled receptors family 3 profile domain-containing protein n=1 Tax=Podarcis muralis TaxID=64176 RepID=A0A670J604_PODMU